MKTLLEHNAEPSLAGGVVWVASAGPRRHTRESELVELLKRDKRSTLGLELHMATNRYHERAVGTLIARGDATGP